MGSPTLWQTEWERYPENKLYKIQSKFFPYVLVSTLQSEQGTADLLLTLASPEHVWLPGQQHLFPGYQHTLELRQKQCLYYHRLTLSTSSTSPPTVDYHICSWQWILKQTRIRHHQKGLLLSVADELEVKMNGMQFSSINREIVREPTH